MILVWGIADAPLRAVLEALVRIGAPAFFLDQGDVHDGRLVDLDAIDAAYIRPVGTRKEPADEAILSWSETTTAYVVNRLSAMASNGSKPYQSLLIREQGFAVPETLLTTDIAALEEFWERHGDVIYKSASGVRSIVGRLTPAHRAKLSRLSACPTQFQQWIAGTDVRVHVVGEEVFASEIESRSTDYRYPQGDEEVPRVRAIDIAPELADRCRRLAGALGLPFAGLDLRRTPAGEWYCFEVNPAPAFTFYSEATGQPIADAVASLLANQSGRDT
ncbi:MAG TPA: RimK domain-containing protein ATP-grasp [Thermoanaerobaculia bacterium]|nr:RimK domain-containing protein ATP-grasp [Thermoanaerobaculia bacterium]